MILTFEIFGLARNHGKKFLKLCQTSFSGIVHYPFTCLSQSPFSNKPPSGKNVCKWLLFGRLNRTCTLIFVKRTADIRAFLLFLQIRLQTKKPMDKSLLNAEGEIWKRIRSTASPTFTAGKIKKVLFPK